MISSADYRRVLGVFLGALNLLILGLLTGCAQLDLPEKLSWRDERPKLKVPILMTDIWTDTVRYTQGKAPQRGFGGRIMFSDKEQGKPVAVDGRLTVYAFDEVHKDMKHLAPLRKFVFPAATLQKHYSKSELGHSYSFWLPWDEVGGPEQKLALVAKFEPTAGGAIMSKESYHLLPGMPGEAIQQPVAKRESQPDEGVRQVSYEASAGRTVQRRRLGPTTFNLPPNFARKIGVSPQSQEAFGGSMQSQAFGGSMSVAHERQSDPLTGSPLEAGATLRQDRPTTSRHWPSDGRNRTDLRKELSMAAAPPTRSSRSRFPAQRSATTGPGSSPIPSQPYRSRWPSSPPASPRSNWPGQWPSPASAAGPPLPLASPWIAD